MKFGFLQFFVQFMIVLYSMEIFDIQRIHTLSATATYEVATHARSRETMINSPR